MYTRIDTIDCYFQIISKFSPDLLCCQQPSSFFSCKIYYFLNNLANVIGGIILTLQTQSKFKIKTIRRLRDNWQIYLFLIATTTIAIRTTAATHPTVTPTINPTLKLPSEI